MAVEQMNAENSTTTRQSSGQAGPAGGFKLYKPNQGKYTRWGTFGGVMLIVVIGAYGLSRQLDSWLTQDWGIWLQYGIPVGLIAVAAAIMVWLVNRPKTADFMIATEGEMKKVSWSSRKEIVGSTKVVIITTIIMAAILAGVDFLFYMLFNATGVAPGVGG